MITNLALAIKNWVRYPSSRQSVGLLKKSIAKRNSLEDFHSRLQALCKYNCLRSRQYNEKRAFWSILHPSSIIHRYWMPLLEMKCMVPLTPPKPSVAKARLGQLLWYLYSWSSHQKIANIINGKQSRRWQNARPIVLICWVALSRRRVKRKEEVLPGRISWYTTFGARAAT